MRTPHRITAGVVCLAIGLLLGCQTPQDKIQSCAQAEAAWAVYQAYIADGATDIDPKVVAAAKVAAAFLSTYCGWTPTASRDAVGRFVERASFDSNGVALVHPPR